LTQTQEPLPEGTFEGSDYDHRSREETIIKKVVPD